MEQFRNEARTIFSLEHPHIVRILEYSLDGNMPYIVMYYTANGSLRKRHPYGTRVPLQTVVEYVKQVAAALQHAHDEGLVHRDIKPDNMLIGKHDEILLSDFGVVTVSSTFNPNQSQNQTGTWAYMAPEQIKRQAVRASDQYALGVTVYEWLCGTPPFEGDWYNLYHQHLNVSPQPLRERVPDLLPNVEQVVMTTLAKDPHQRFATVQAFATALQQASQAKSSRIVSPLQPTPPPESRILAPSVSTQTSAEIDTPAVQVIPPTVLTVLTDTPAKSQPSTNKHADAKRSSALRLKLTRRQVLVSLAATGVVAAGGGAVWWILAPHPLYTYRGHSDGVYAVAWSPDGKRIASGSWDHTVQVWDAVDGGNVYTYKGHSDPTH